MCKQLTRALGCNAESVAVGRQAVSHALASWGLLDDDPAAAVAEDVVLATSELLGNAVKAGWDHVIVHLEANRDHIVVSVEDDNPAAATRRDAAPTHLGGRGLNIIEALASSWGQTPWDGHHKAVWADFDLPGSSALANNCLR